MIPDQIMDHLEGVAVRFLTAATEADRRKYGRLLTQAVGPFRPIATDNYLLEPTPRGVAIRRILK